MICCKYANARLHCTMPEPISAGDVAFYERRGEGDTREFLNRFRPTARAAVRDAESRARREPRLLNVQAARVIASGTRHRSGGCRMGAQ